MVRLTDDRLMRERDKKLSLLTKKLLEHGS